MDDEIKKAMATGEENRELIALGKAWCTNIRTDRSGFGIGMVEQMTGLPITGGRFTCDHARRIGGVAGMRLEVSAVAFYENNCQGCQQRASGERVPNLSTWAEQIISARLEAEMERAQTMASDEAARERRSEERRMIGASMSAAAQEVIALVNGIDSDDPANDADERLRAVAQLTPEVFDNGLLQIVMTEAGVLRSAVLLEVAVNLLEAGRSFDANQLHALVLEATSSGWGRDPGARYLEQYARRADIDGGLIDSLVHHAAPSRGVFYGATRRARPGALLRYHELDAGLVEDRLRFFLRHGESWYRSDAAGAADALLEKEPDAALRLLGALLDSLKHRDDREYGGDESGSAVQGVVGRLLARFPLHVDETIGSTWARATPEFRVKLLGSYDSLFRHNHQEVTAQSVRVSVSRAIAALSEEANIYTVDFQDDFQGQAADLLKLLLPRTGNVPVPLEPLLGTFLVWVERASQVARKTPDIPFGEMEQFGAIARVGRIVNDLSEAVVVAGLEDPEGLLRLCADIYGSDQANDEVRAEILRVIERLVKWSPDVAHLALSTVYNAMLGAEQVVRAAGLRVAAEVIRSLGPDSIPPLLAQAVLAGLSDSYLVVVLEAIEVVQKLPLGLVPQRETSVSLLLIADRYSKDRARGRMVQEALTGAMGLAIHDEGFLRIATDVALRVIHGMHAHQAREILSGMRQIQAGAGWVDEAIHAMRPDEDAQYERFGHEEKKSILRELGRRTLTTEQLEAFVSIESAPVQLDRDRAEMVADVLSENGRADLGATVLVAHLKHIPDTTERRRIRAALGLQVKRLEVEAAISSGDLTQAQSLADMMKQIRHDGDVGPHDGDMLAEVETRVALVGELELVAGGSRDHDGLRFAIDEHVARRGTQPSCEHAARSLSETLEALWLGVRWKAATWLAESDASRFATAARLRASEVLKSDHQSLSREVVAAASDLASLAGESDVALAAHRLVQMQIAPRLSKLFEPSRRFKAEPEDSATVERTPSVALVVRHNGEAVMRPTILRPNAMHQLEVEVRVDSWPAEADELRLRFVSVHPRDYLFVSDVTFSPDRTIGPLEVRIAGERPLNCPPLAVTAHAVFSSGSERFPASLVGNTTLELATFDEESDSLLGMPTTALRLRQIMNELANAIPDLPIGDRRDFQLLMAGILRFGHTVLDDRVDAASTKVDELWFQRELKQFLQADPKIGARLGEATARAGGITDLLLGNVVLELKLEKTSSITIDAAANRFGDQVTQYGSAGDSRISILAVLDALVKRAPSGVMGNELSWFYPDTTAGPGASLPSMVGVVIIRSGFPIPSQYSR